MTPPLALKPVITPLDGHLTEEQFGELIAAAAGPTAGTTPAETHVRDCEQCAAELASLRECLCLFREASTAYADRELRGVPQVILPARRRLLFFPELRPAYLAAAAAAIFLAALLPIQMHRQRVPHPAPVAAVTVAAAPAESDEALLEDVNDEVSASVPASMQALADPTASATSTSTGIETSNQNPDQRN
jgi:hypothetical protein